MYIKRHISDFLYETSKHFSSILVTGARQVGKSTVLQHTFDKAGYYLLDNPAYIDSIAIDPVGFLETIGWPVIIDEVQLTPYIFSSLKYIIDSNRQNGMYYLSGSQKFNLMQGVSESLAGRVALINLMGLSMREINADSFNQPFIPTMAYLKVRKSNLGNPQLTNMKVLWKTIFTGSMPRLYEDPDENWQTFYASYVSTYIQRDVRQIINISDIKLFTNFITALAARNAQVLNIASISKEIGVSQPTIKKWLGVLEASNLIYLLQPYSPNIGKRIIKSPKIYFTDTGLVCYLCRWWNPEVLSTGAQAGSIFETFVINEILKSHINVGREPDMYYFRNSNGQEVDLLLRDGDTLHPIEIKMHKLATKKDTKNFGTLQTAYPGQKFGEGGIVCPADDLIPLGKNVKVIPVSYI